MFFTKKTISLAIPTPCHENWEEMTPMQNGKFCSNCQKKVIDFSLMSDREIIAYFEGQNGIVCGRMTQSQLARPLSYQPAKQTAALAKFVFSFLSILAVKNAVAQTPLYVTNAPISKHENMDIATTTEIDTTKAQDEIIIEGTVVDSIKNEGAYPANIILLDDSLKSTGIGTTTDVDGNFSLRLTPQKAGESIHLLVSALGYERKYFNYVINKENENFRILVKVAITNHFIGLISYKPPTLKQKIKRFFSRRKKAKD